MPCLEFLAFHSQRRSRRGRRAHNEGMAAAARGRAHGGRVGGVGARRAGREQLVARVRPKAGMTSRCSRCGRTCPGYDTSPEPRRWRGLDLDTTPVFLQATTRRVGVRPMGWWSRRCRGRGPGRGSRTRSRTPPRGWSPHATLSVVAVLLRIAWRSVSGIVTRVVAERAGAVDRLARLSVASSSWSTHRRAGPKIVPAQEPECEGHSVVTDRPAGDCPASP